ncbi:aa3-type cytochrome c oxidase subunit IV [Hyphomicrobium sp.]|nr:aa3-type cytochrome c oxidase subunit IV [Hyphomicrobium sp.]MCC7251813.1 aa3-type cytochrome c oxidase subunit IV [Hyphomicrobium sp.]
MATYDPVVDADYPAHVQTYRSFVRGVMLAIATAALVLTLLAVFLL